jgi:hypothetical protein
MQWKWISMNEILFTVSQHLHFYLKSSTQPVFLINLSKMMYGMPHIPKGEEGSF